VSVVQDEAVDEAQDRVSSVYEEHGRRMWRALVGFAGDPEIASDAMAEAFARALRDAAEIRDVASWTWRVAFRIAASELRRRTLTDAVSEPAYEMPEPMPELMSALKQLSPNQRMVVVLHDYADRPTAEVSELLGCSKATVHVHLSQGRRRLRALLEER